MLLDHTPAAAGVDVNGRHVDITGAQLSITKNYPSVQLGVERQGRSIYNHLFCKHTSEELQNEYETRKVAVLSFCMQERQFAEALA